MLNAEVPVLEKVIMEAFPEREILTDYLVMPIHFTDVGDCYCVLLRLRTNRTRYITVFLPGKSAATGRPSRHSLIMPRSSVCRRLPMVGTRSFTFIWAMIL